MRLSEISNLGKIISAKFEEVEILDIESLIEIGAEQAFIRIVTVDEECACPQMLYALEGAIQNIRWHNLDLKRKSELKDFYNFILKKK